MPPKPASTRISNRLKSVPPPSKVAEKPKSSRKRAASVAVGAEDEAAPPRKRGRPAKNPSAAGLEPIKENVPEKIEEATEAAEKSEKPVSRRRGRPPKNQGATTATTTTPLARGSRTKAINAVPTAASHPRPPRLCWIFGTGDFGQFGLGTETLGEITRPRLHAWFESATQKDILGSQGAGIERIAAGGMHTLVIDEAGKVWSWGINDNAALGRPTVDVPDPDKPDEQIEAEILETQPMVLDSLVEENFRAVEVAAGDSVSVALGEHGDLRAWGSFRSSEGLLGFDGRPGSSKTQLKPLPIDGLTPYQFVQLACGDDHVLALTTAGHVYTWGAGQSAQLGRKIIERRKINGLAPERLALRSITLIGTGSFHSFAVDVKGVVYAWGLNMSRQTGISVERGGDEGIIWQPTIVDALHPDRLGGRRVVQITGGEHHSIFLLDDGTVMGCGRCDEHQIGLTDDHPAMKDLEDRKAAAKKAAEELQKEAAEEAAKKRAENPEDEGEEDKPPAPTGNIEEYIPEPVVIPFPPPPTADDPNPPVPPYNPKTINSAPLNPIASLSARSRHNLAVSRDGHAYSWGLGLSFTLGLGPDVEMQPLPTRIKNKALEGAKLELAAAGSQHCLLVGTKNE
ncbi:hypothetical protein M422DRAFT_777621 [Sphaerobolus stellatus SS14]|nr:hypothetical protein M422DRAFT_777621 [Sphaerobolus stellatus SS14]